MKTFSLIWNIFIAILVVVLGVIIIIDYHKTKDNAEISPEDLKQLKPMTPNIAERTPLDRSDAMQKPSPTTANSHQHPFPQ